MRIVNDDEPVSYSTAAFCHLCERSILLPCNFSEVNTCPGIAGQESACRCLLYRQRLEISMLTASVNDRPNIDCNVDDNHNGSKQELNFPG